MENAPKVLRVYRIPKMLRAKFQKATKRVTMFLLYSFECWERKKRKDILQDKCYWDEMHRWMSNKPKKGRIRNNGIRDNLGVAPIGELS